MKCTCAYSWGAQAIRPWAEQISQAQQERIRNTFPSVKPMNETPLALPEHASAGAVTNRSPVVIDMEPVAEYHTGYARIDNAIIDALRGQSGEVKDGVYDIIRNDLVPYRVHGVEEADRLAQISLGVEKAEYLTNQFMDDKTKSSFMEAIRAIAKIGTEGTRVGNCEMKYQVKHVIIFDGTDHVMENPSEEYLFAMERLSPEDYETYKRLSDAGGEGVQSAGLFLVSWAMKNIDAVAGMRTAYDKHKDELYDKLGTVKLDQTFAGADTSSKENFLASIREKLQANQNLQMQRFLDQLTKMAEAPDKYLTTRKRYIWARA